MFTFLKNLFLSDKKKILKVTTKTSITTSTIKTEYYHEIVGNTIRVYSRKSGLVEEMSSPTPYKAAISLLLKYNKGGI